MRRGAKPGKDKVDAKRPRARKSPTNEASERRDLEKRLAESLEREKATVRFCKSSRSHLLKSSPSSRPSCGTPYGSAAACMGACIASTGSSSIQSHITVSRLRSWRRRGGRHGLDR